MKTIKKLATAYDSRAFSIPTIADVREPKRTKVARPPKYSEEFWVRIRTETAYLSRREQAKLHKVTLSTVKYWRNKAWATKAE